MLFIPRSAAGLVALCADGSTRFALSGLRVSAMPGGRWRIDASDGKALAILRGPSTPHDLDKQLAQGLPEQESLLPSAVVPAKAFGEMLKAIPRQPRGQSADRTACVLLASPEIVLAAGKRVVPCKPVDGHYPDCDLVLPKKPALFSFTVNPDLLIDLLRAASQVSKTTGELPKVEFLFWSKDKPIGVITQGAGGLVFDGLLMPLA